LIVLSEVAETTGELKGLGFADKLPHLADTDKAFRDFRAGILFWG
jgi:hypothetical protein